MKEFLSRLQAKKYFQSSGDFFRLLQTSKFMLTEWRYLYFATKGAKFYRQVCSLFVQYLSIFLKTNIVVLSLTLLQEVIWSMKCLPSLSWTLLMTSSMWFTPSLVRNFSDISSISMSWLNLTVLLLLLLLLYIPLQPMLPFRIDLQVEDLLNNNLPEMLVHGFFPPQPLFEMCSWPQVESKFKCVRLRE